MSISLNSMVGVPGFISSNGEEGGIIQTVVQIGIVLIVVIINNMDNYGDGYYCFFSNTVNWLTLNPLLQLILYQLPFHYQLGIGLTLLD